MTEKGDERRLRLFVACDLPDAVLRAVTRWQREELGSREELRLTGSLHLTLAFLGLLPATDVPALERALAAVDWRGARLA